MVQIFFIVKVISPFPAPEFFPTAAPAMYFWAKITNPTMTRPDENQRTLRELPPRRLDWYSQAVMLFGDNISQAGWLLLAIGSYFFWTTAVNSEVKYWFEDKAIRWSEKAGVILSADSTATQEDGTRIWKYRHSFSLDDGYRYLGTSFSLGKKFDAGQIAYIRYDSKRPTTNHLVSLRRSEHNWRVNLLLLLPALGLWFVLHPVRDNLHFLKLLRIGDFTRGQFDNKTATGQSVKNGAKVLPVFRYQFRFQHEGVIYLAVCYTHLTHLVEDETTESILYDRFQPAFNLVYDAVPNVPPIGPDGRLGKMRAEKAWVLFLPVFVVALNLAFAMGRG